MPGEESKQNGKWTSYQITCAIRDSQIWTALIWTGKKPNFYLSDEEVHSRRGGQTSDIVFPQDTLSLKEKGTLLIDLVCLWQTSDVQLLCAMWKVWPSFGSFPCYSYCVKAILEGCRIKLFAIKPVFKLKHSKNHMAKCRTMKKSIINHCYFLEQSIIVNIIKAYGYSDRIHRLESKKTICMVSAITVFYSYLFNC